MRIRQIILFVTLLFCNHYLFSQKGIDNRYELLQKKCKTVIAKDDGCIGIVDLRSQKVVTVVNNDLLAANMFKPGSIIKILVTVAAINTGKIDPNLEYDCTGKAIIEDETFHCWLPKGHSKINFTNAIAQSCNLFFYNLASKLSLEDIQNIFEIYKMGIKTPFNLPGESSGLFKKVNNNIEKYYLATGRSENLLVTPLQMLYMISVIANHGNFLDSKLVLNSAKFNVLYKGLRNSVLLGTSKESNYINLPAAGKTGTSAEKYNTKTSAWFVGYAPYDNPEIAIVVFIKKGRGATNAAPIAKKVFKCYYDIFHR